MSVGGRPSFGNPVSAPDGRSHGRVRRARDGHAIVFGIAPKTLRKHFRDELDTGNIKASAKVADNRYRIATGRGREAVTAAIFWLKVRAGWREPLGVREYAMGKRRRGNSLLKPRQS